MNTSNLITRSYRVKVSLEKAVEKQVHIRKVEGEHGKCTYIYILLYELHLDSADYSVFKFLGKLIK